MKKYDIINTDKETLKKWYSLLTLGRAIDVKAPVYLIQSLGWSYHAPYAVMMVFSWLSDRFLNGEKIFCSLITGICLLYFQPV